MVPFQSSCYRTHSSSWKQIKKPPDTGGLNFWYSVLSKYRAKDAEIEDVGNSINNFYIQNYLDILN